MKSYLILLTLLILLKIAPLSQASEVRGAFPADSRQLEKVLRKHPEYLLLWKDQQFRLQFDQYMRWLSSAEIAAPDAIYPMSLVDSGVTSMDLQSHLFHELVEFKNWMRLGHKAGDIMNREYYSRHYATVYPRAHCNAIVAQERILRSFAKTKGLGMAPMLAYDLAFPDYERREALKQFLPTPILVRQLRYNQTQLERTVRVKDIKLAIRTFEKGGYSYQDRNLVLKNAAGFLKFAGLCSVCKVFLSANLFLLIRSKNESTSALYRPPFFSLIFCCKRVTASKEDAVVDQSKSFS
jgi:hypothetical protein